jgi:hypothetical protein
MNCVLSSVLAASLAAASAGSQALLPPSDRITGAVPGILVSGRVTRSGTPGAGLRVMFHPWGPARYSKGPRISAPSADLQWNTAVTRDDGSYALLVDRPGEAQVWIQTLDHTTGFLSGLITIPDSDAHTINVNLSGVLVPGIVVDQDTGLPMTQVRVMATSRRDMLPPSTWQMAKVTTGDDGRFQFQLEPVSTR